MKNLTPQSRHWDRGPECSQVLTCWLSGTFRTSTSVIFRGMSLS